MSNKKFESMAQDIFFNGGKVEEILSRHGMELLNGKHNGDFIRAFNSGIQKGRGKFEREMMEAGLSLSNVCRITSR